MGCGKRALCREQQAPLIALVWCNSPSKECLSPSLSIWPSSLPKHSGNVSTEEEVSICFPQEFPHAGGREIRATRATLKKREWDNTPLKSVKTVVYELYTQPAVVSFTHRFHQHGNKKDPNTSLELASWYGHTLLQSEHVVPRSAHAKNKDHLCLYTTVAKQNSCEKVLSTMFQTQPLQITN